MIKFLKRAYFPLALIFIGAICSTGAYFSDSVDITSNEFSTGLWSVTAAATETATATATETATATSTPSLPAIVLNEFLANSSGGDSDPMPNGEWVELYNTSDSSVDLSGWYLYDEANNVLPLINGNIESGSTTIPANGFMVVYRNGYSFSLNEGNDTVKLYDGNISTGTMVDSYYYTGTPTDKTWARLPDGTGGWTNHHDQTKGGPNV